MKRVVFDGLCPVMVSTATLLSLPQQASRRQPHMCSAAAQPALGHPASWGPPAGMGSGRDPPVGARAA